MGYETTMIVCERHDSYKNGKYPEKVREFLDAVGHVELCCCGDGPMGSLIISHTPKDEQLEKDCREFRKLYAENHGTDGDYSQAHEELTREEKKKVDDRLSALRKKLGHALPYVYWESGNEAAFTDRYGSLLITCTVKEAYETLIRDNARCVAKKEFDSVYGYGRFHIAIKFLEAIMQCFDAEDLVVVLWGH